MKHFFSIFSVLFFATSLLAQSGLTCEDAIPVDKNYRATIDGPCEIWYTANTYDLPIHVYFTPVVDNSSWGPEVQVDLTCIPGVYADAKIDSLINLVSDFDVAFPLELLSELVVRDGKNEWDLSISKTYRDNMAEFGVTYPVQAFVKVTYFEAGTVSLTPDTAFTSCMENAEHVVLGDTLEIKANDAERVFVFPYSEWQEEDSLRFVWTGDEPLQVFLAVQECSFETSKDNPYVWEVFSLSSDKPRKLYPDEIKAAIDKHKEGGLYYAKVIAPCSGQLVVEQIPLAEIEGGAKLLEYGQTIPVSDVSDQLYCFPKTWLATEFKAPTSGNVKLFLSTTTEFSASDDDPNVLTSYELELVNGARELCFSNVEMSVITARAVNDYIYVRFLSDESTTLSINEWVISSCANNSRRLYPNVERSIAAKSYRNIYRLKYADFKGGAITITWTGNSTLPTFLAQDCNLDLSTSADNLLLNPAPAIGRKGKLTIDAATVNSWASRIDEEGFMYVCFNPNNTGRVKFVVTKPDPIYTTIAESVCYGETYTWNGQTYAATGEYQQTFVAANGADSIVTLQLTVRPEVPATEEHVTVAYSETHTWHGVTYTESGSYSVTLQDAFGCDSVVTLHLTVLPNPDRTELYPNDYMILNLASAFKVFTMEHLSWVAQDVNIHWGGTSPLYVFIASENDFALTPYNRYVLHYEEIAAGGDWILTASQMASWAQHAAAAGGKVYVRFLTEEEGELTTKGL